MSVNNYDWLISNLDAFIRKYYANKVIRGSLIFLTCLIAYILVITLGEYFFYLPATVKVGALALLGLAGVTALIVWVVVPLTKMARLGQTITHEDAAQIIGQHFSDVSDKLLNILQLKSRTDNDGWSRELAEASINQKIASIKVIPFKAAVDFRKNKKYLPYLLPLVLAVVGILIASPDVFKESTGRLLQPTKTFEKPAPFEFKILNKDLQAVRNADFVLEAEVSGRILPAEAFVDYGGEKVPMEVLPNHKFKFTFKNVTANTDFRIFAADFYTKPYSLKVVQRPILKAFKIQINYPAYTGKKSESRTSLSDMVVPVGTSVTWSLTTDHTDDATIQFGNSGAAKMNGSDNKFSYGFRFLSDTTYTVALTNKEAGIVDSYKYAVQVVPDQYPVIQLQQKRDTISGKQIVITGTAGDDYGITKATFNYEVSENNHAVEKKSVPIKITPGAVAQLEQYFDVETLHLKQGQKVSFYIEAWDNDGVHGAKSARSEMMSYQMLDARQVDSAINENSKQISAGLSSSAEQTKQLQSEYKDMQSKLLQSESMDWNQQQNLQEMMEKQKGLKEQMETVKQHLEEQIQQSEQKKYSDDLREKQKELSKQMENMLNNELKEQLKKLQELMQKLNKEQAMEAMKKLEQENKLFKMDMQRMQEEMSRMEQQMRMEDLGQKLDDLGKKEEELSKQAEKGEKSSEELNAEQKKLEKELDKSLKEDMKEIEKLAKQNKQDKDLDQMKKDAEDAEKDMQDAEKQLDQKDNKTASKSQKSAAQKLSKAGKKMKSAAGDMSPEEVDLDIKATRQLLSNLIRMSFDQEALIASVRQTLPSTVQYLKNQEEQNRLHTVSYMIRDSLAALAKKIPKLPVNINKMTTDLEGALQRSVDALEERNKPLALTNGQYVMTYTNDLALILNELLANLMQMPNSGSGEGMGMGKGKKPGGKQGKGGPLGDIITEQQNLGNAMQQLANKMGRKPGNKPGSNPGNSQGEGKAPGNQDGKGPGKQPGKGQQPGGASEGGSGGGGNGTGQDGENENSEAIGQLAQKQAEIRRQMQQLAAKLTNQGLNGAARQLRELEGKMDKVETDIVNRRFTQDMMTRQSEILTRLLESEKAIREQEQDDKRASNTAKEISRPVPPSLQKFLSDQKQLMELYKTVPPQLKPYYKEMVEQYFHILGTGK